MYSKNRSACQRRSKVHPAGKDTAKRWRSSFLSLRKKSVNSGLNQYPHDDFFRKHVTMFWQQIVNALWASMPD